jgi:hypothetical protein
MTMTDAVTALLALASFVALCGWAISLWVKYKDDERNYDQYLNDIRLQKTYASYFISAITVFFGLAVRTNLHLDRTAVILLLSALCSAAITVSFLPIRRPKTTRAHSPELWAIRILWICKLVPLNLTMILTVLGLVDALQSTLVSGTPT